VVIAESHADLSYTVGVSEGVEGVLEKLLDHGADPFAPSAGADSPDDVRPPVEKAIESPDDKWARIFLTNNASPVRRTPRGETALHLAVKQALVTPSISKSISKGGAGAKPAESAEPVEGWTNVIDILLSRGFSADQTNDDGLTPLQELAWGSANGLFIPTSNPPPYFQHTSRATMVADFLLSRGATLDVFSAAGFGLTNQLAAFLRANPKLGNLRDRLGRTPLHYAACGNSHATAMLLEAGADPAASTTKPVKLDFQYFSVVETEVSALQLACRSGNQENVQLLLKAGAPVAQADGGGDTPLHIAAYGRNPNITQLLISAGAPLDVTNHAGQTPLRFAIYSGGSGNLTMLLKAGARQDIGLSNTTLLQIALAGGYVPAIPELVGAGVSVDERDGQGRTQFQRAVTALDLFRMELLLRNGADINALDVQGDAALHLLATQPVDKVVSLLPGYMPAQQTSPSEMPTTNISLTAWLLEHGANPNLTNHDGQTPLDVLRAHKWATSDEEKAAAARIILLEIAMVEMAGPKEQIALVEMAGPKEHAQASTNKTGAPSETFHPAILGLGSNDVVSTMRLPSGKLSGDEVLFFGKSSGQAIISWSTNDVCFFKGRFFIATPDRGGLQFADIYVSRPFGANEVSLDRAVAFQKEMEADYLRFDSPMRGIVDLTDLLRDEVLADPSANAIIPLHSATLVVDGGRLVLLFVSHTGLTGRVVLDDQLNPISTAVTGNADAK
jgi:ankyrin repeat protein